MDALLRVSCTAKLRQVPDLVDRPLLRYKDVCKRDMKSAEINPDLWETSAVDLSNWRRVIWTGVKRAKAKRKQLWHDNFRTLATNNVHMQQL